MQSFTENNNEAEPNNSAFSVKTNKALQNQRSKEAILKKIRAALVTTTPLPYPGDEDSSDIFFEPEGGSNKEDLSVAFAESFTVAGGYFVYNANAEELAKNLHQLITEKGYHKIYCANADIVPLLQSIGVEPYPDLATCDAAITDCDYLIARTGSIVLSSVQEGGRQASIYAPVHICIAYTPQIEQDIKNALVQYQSYKTIPSLISFATGPSRTADIEKTLVTGVHGPKEVYCFLVDYSEVDEP